MSMKRIITCSDGTWNRIGSDPTNVQRIFKCIPDKGPDGIPQLKAYDEGVGTGHSWWDKFWGGLTGEGLDRNIIDMYTFLVMTYEPGDEIYLFGFSRGAYTTRSLAGFIYNCGILRKENIHMVERAYGLYRNRNEFTHPDSDMMRVFRTDYGHNPRPKIKFIGVWDTVGSLGIPVSWYKNRNMSKYKFHDCKLNNEIENAFHALAINERRKVFEPTLWEMSETAKKEGRQKLEQRWFAGAHSNVGGGYPDSRLSDIVLEWLMKKAAETGLHVADPRTVDMKPAFNPHIDGRNYKSHRVLPYLLFKSPWRKVQQKADTCETIDDSVYELVKAGKLKLKNIKVA